MSITSERQVLDAVLRESLSAFIEKVFATVSPADTYAHGWHQDVIADVLERVCLGEIKRLIISVPPRSGKSIATSVAFPAWVLGHDPRRRIICASFANDLSIKFARDCRSVIESDWYRALFPGTRLSRGAEDDLETTKQGTRYATSVGGTLTGLGGDIVILDDPMKPDDARSEVRRQAMKNWYDGTLYSRLNSKANSCIIIVMQRLHIDDLVGHVLNKENWHVLELPAIAEETQEFELQDGRRIVRHEGDVLHPAREPRDVLMSIKRNVGTFNFEAQYQQRPIPMDGNLIKWSWFQRYDEPPSLEKGDRIVQSWDTAQTKSELSSYSVCTTWHVKGNDYYLLDVFRDRLDFPELKQALLRQGNKFRARTILVEDAASGIALIQEIRKERIVGFPKPIGIRPEGDKVMRMSTQSAKVEAGHVHIPRRAPWLDEFRKEMRTFPQSAHDDQIDSVSQFLKWIDDRKRNIARSGSYYSNG